VDVPVNQVQLEIHPTGTCTEEPARFPWQEADPAPAPPPLALTETDGLVGVRVDPKSGQLERVEARGQAAFVLKVSRRRLSAELVLIARGESALVNGVPAPPLAVLSVGDSLGLGPGLLAHVTERVTPYVGPPVGELIGKKCAHCRIPAGPETRVVTHRCGVLYHYETAESHPQTPEHERLNCFEKVSACLSCKRELTLQPHLAWDPRSL
jgi:hypothetical protein